MKYTLRYGTLELTGRMISTSQREEVYVNRAGEAFVESCFVVNALDCSPRVTSTDRTSPNFRQYSASCSCCWLGFTTALKNTIAL